MVLYVLSVAQFQMKVGLCIEKLDCLGKVLHLELLNEQIFVVEIM